MYTILIVEDDTALRYVYSKMTIWEEYGFEITGEAGNGKEALEKLKDNQYDVVITDIRMPVVDGLSLLKEMNEQKINIKTVLISSYDEFEYARQGIILGAFDYVVKPVKPEALGKMLARLREEISRDYSDTAIDSSVLQVLEDMGLDYKDNQFISKICSYISENMQNLVSMEDVAEHMQYSKDYFGKCFKKEIGIPFNTFYSQIKIQYAKYLIVTENKKNYELSDILGYSSADYFTKIFKNVTGMTPAQYRNTL